MNAQLRALVICHVMQGSVISAVLKISRSYHREVRFASEQLLAYERICRPILNVVVLRSSLYN